jgi:hypothetical protein
MSSYSNYGATDFDASVASASAPAAAALLLCLPVSRATPARRPSSAT